MPGSQLRIALALAPAVRLRIRFPAGFSREFSNRPCRL